MLHPADSAIFVPPAAAAGSRCFLNISLCLQVRTRAYQTSACSMAPQITITKVDPLEALTVSCRTSYQINAIFWGPRVSCHR